MSDLISKNKAIQRFIQETVDSNSNLIHINTAKRLLQDVDTAYSVDKVIEELELHSFELGTDTLPVHYVRLNDAVEIVKQGGVSDASDDVCEWKAGKSNDEWQPNCEPNSTYNVFDCLDYMECEECPYYYADED